MDDRYVLFDFDGVIANTEESNCRYLEKVLGCFGIMLTDKDRRALIGTNDQGNLIRLLERSPQNVSVEQLLRRRREVGNTYEDGDIRPMPGLIPMIICMRETGWKTGIVTSTSSRLIVTALNRMKMTSLFDVIICGDMCDRKKPDPEGYLKAMAFLNASPDRCIVFEDSTVGIRAAKAAGAVVIAYTGSGIEQDVSQADAVLDDYAKWEEIGCFVH